MVARMCLLEAMALVIYFVTLLIAVFLRFPLYGYILTIFLFSIFIMRFELVALKISWVQTNDGYPDRIIRKELVWMFLYIFAYALIYKYSCFVFNDSNTIISIKDSIIYSLEMWTGVGSDLTPLSKDIQIISLLQALQGYFFLAFIFFMVANYFWDIKYGADERVERVIKKFSDRLD